MNEEQNIRLSDLQRLQAEQITAKPSTRPSTISGPLFNQVLAEQIKEPDTERITFSNHALQRLKKRNISFGPQDLERLNDALSKLQSKGAKESLVLMDEVALIVGIKHKTVITAMDRSSMKGSIVTNIDSAIIT